MERFEDKVYACWMGKNIGGTLGGPLEGRMELLDITNYTQSFVEAVENDDLDLQLVALHCVEQYGGVVTTARLAQEWRSHVHFQFDEYGHALTNLRKGLRPPLSGAYNNFFTDCMGSPIRSELWGILCAGMPDLAAYYAFQDASVDHAGGEGVYGEIFFAVFESLAFTTTDIDGLIARGLSFLPPDCATTGAVKLLLEGKARGLTWQENRQALIDRYGGENFTYAPINIAFTLMGLLYGQGFTERLLITTNCGYDTDCTCATIASMMGILYGSEYIDSMWTEPLGENIIVSPPVNGFDAPKTIKELTERSLRCHRLVSALYETAPDKSVFRIDREVDKEVTLLPAGSFFIWDTRCETRYEDGHPAVRPGGQKRVSLRVENSLPVPRTLRLSAEAAGCGAAGAQTVTLEPGGNATYTAALARTCDAAAYPGYFRLQRLENGSLWSEEAIPFVLLPTQDWAVSLDGGKARPLYCPDSRIPVENLALEGTETLTAKTRLCLGQGKALRLIACCRQPLTMRVDGAVVAQCGEETAEIPAYHRADPRKCANLDLSAGYHDVEVRVDRARDIKNLYFYVVDPQKHCGADIAYRLALPDGIE